MKNKNNITWIVALIVLIFLLLIIPTWNLYGFRSMMGSYYGGYGMMGGFGWIFMLVLFIAIILFIVWLIQQLLNNKK